MADKAGPEPEQWVLIAGFRSSHMASEEQMSGSWWLAKITFDILYAHIHSPFGQNPGKI